MNKHRKFCEDKQIIGTCRYASFQKMCSNAGLLAIKEAKKRGLPITYVENEKIVKEYSDGKIEILGMIKPNVKVNKWVYTIK